MPTTRRVKINVVRVGIDISLPASRAISLFGCSHRPVLLLSPSFMYEKPPAKRFFVDKFVLTKQIDWRTKNTADVERKYPTYFAVHAKAFRLRSLPLWLEVVPQGGVAARRLGSERRHTPEAPHVPHHNERTGARFSRCSEVDTSVPRVSRHVGCPVYPGGPSFLLNIFFALSVSDPCTRSSVLGPVVNPTAVVAQ